MKKLIVEVRMNEGAKKPDNSHVAYTPDEIIADAIECANAGAVLVHFHARKEDGAESNEVDDYRRIIGGIRARTDVMVHPTLGLFHGARPDQRLSHISALAASDDLRPEIAPLDMGSNNLDFWNPETKSFVGDGYVYQNLTSDLRIMASRLSEWRVKPQLALWTVANARLMGVFVEAGLLKEPVFPVLFLSGDRFVAGHPATSAGLRAFADNLPDCRCEWSVLVHQANMLPLIPEIVSLGGHVSIGLGDYAYPEIGCPSNAELVGRVAQIARTMGRELATANEAREMLAA